MKSRLTLAALALTFAIGACDRDAPTSPATGVDNQTPAAPTAPIAGKAKLIGNVVDAPTTFVSTGSPPGVTPVVTAGTVFTVAKVQITKFSYVGGQLMVEGGLFDPAGNLISAFGPTPATLTKGGSPTQPTCPILDLDIGAIHLNLLGLVVDLAPVHLDIVAQSGPGNLLGNLLCAVANLLNPPTLGGLLGGLLAALQNLLNQINLILAGL
jgi:hypothetical protein